MSVWTNKRTVEWKRMRQGTKDDCIEWQNVKIVRSAHFKRQRDRLTDRRADGHYPSRKREHKKTLIFSVQVRENQSEFIYHLFPPQLTPTKVAKVMLRRGGGMCHFTHEKKGTKCIQIADESRKWIIDSFLFIPRSQAYSSDQYIIFTRAHPFTPRTPNK